MRLVATIIAFVMPYLIGAFTSWNFDVSSWDEAGRFMVASGSIWAAGVVFFIPEWRK